jgi:hypothetical protein
VPGSLANLADTYESELQIALRVMTNMIEPVIICVMALGVGFLLVSVLSALFAITSSISVRWDEPAILEGEAPADTCGGGVHAHRDHDGRGHSRFDADHGHPVFPSHVAKGKAWARWNATWSRPARRRAAPPS